MTPTIGRIVLYRIAQKGDPIPALVCRVDGEILQLAAFQPLVLQAYDIRKGGDPGNPAPGTWNWPRREE